MWEPHKTFLCTVYCISAKVVLRNTKMSRSLPTRLKVTHSTVTSILEGLRVTSLCTSMVLVRRGCTSTVSLSPSHLTEEHQDEHRRVKTALSASCALERSCSIAIQLENLQSINQMYFIQPFFFTSAVFTPTCFVFLGTGTRGLWELGIQRRCRSGW